MAARRLIVNADGFGFGPGATRGVIDAIRDGRFITSVSVNANFPEVEEIPRLTREFPHISVGVHLNPMVGKPCLPRERVRSLVGPDGLFHYRNFLPLLRRGAIAFDELEAEFHAQVQKVRDLVGERLTHLDSHGHSHLHYFDLFLDLARKFGIERIRSNASVICLEAPRPATSRLRAYLSEPSVWVAHQYRRFQMRRARTAGLRLADRLVTVGYANTGNKTNPDNWPRILKNLPPGTSEIYCHPGYPDETLRRWSDYLDERVGELRILRRPMLRAIAAEAGVELINFSRI